MAELTAAGAEAGDMFGSSIAISGGTAVVAAVGHDDKAGGVFVFTDTAAGWRQTAELEGADTASNDQFGTSLAVSGHTIVVGAEDAGADAGRAYVFAEVAGGWRQTAELAGSGTVTYDQFGSAVAVAGGTIAVGADFHDARAGRVYVFTKRRTRWVETAELSGRDTSTYDEFGCALAMTPTTIVVGAEYHDSESGSAYVFTKVSGGWRQTAELRGSDTGTFDYFGASVAISGRNVVVGAYDRAAGAGGGYVFSESRSGWRQTAELKSPGGAAVAYFGSSVAISGRTLVIGASHADGTGAAYVFTDTSKGWTEEAALKGSDVAVNDAFGTSVAFSGTTVIVGAEYHVSSRGSIYVFGL